MSLRRVSVLAAVMLALGSAVAVANPNSLFSQTVAQNQEGQRPQRGNREGLMKELNLTPQQMQQMQEIRRQNKAKVEQSASTLRQAKQELTQLMAGDASTDQIRQKYQQVETLRQQMADLRFENMLAMREILTPEQRSKFAQLMQQRQEKSRDRRGNRGEQQGLGL